MSKNNSQSVIHQKQHLMVPEVEMVALGSDAEQTDYELIASYLADLTKPDEMEGAILAVQVGFGPASEEMLISQQNAELDTGLLTCGLQSENGPTAREGPNVTTSTEIPLWPESGSVPIDSVPIKIIFGDNGSTSGTII